MDWAALLADISSLHAHKCTIEYVDPPKNFPFERAYAPQSEAISKIISSKSIILSPHTGSGKSAVFLTATRDNATLVIEPRKFLQKQIASYYNDTIMYGRSEYACYYAPNAGIAPCMKKLKCSETFYKDDCPEANSTCAIRKCKVFQWKEKPSIQFRRYPCGGCEYIGAQTAAIDALKAGGTVVCNFGNFWNLLKFADTVVIDETDLFFREISSPRRIHSATDDTDIPTMLDNELKYLVEKLKTATPNTYYKYQNAILEIGFLSDNNDLCFSYKKVTKKYEAYFVEINPANVNILKDRIFAGKRVIIVTATPTGFPEENITYSIPQRCKIYYTPVGKLTSKQLKAEPWLIERAGQFIETMTSMFTGMYGSQKFVVHCGNIGTHATGLYEYLEKDPLHQICELHSAGDLMGTIDRFVASDKRYLLVASAEYGADFTWCDCQFILKVPYATLDDRMRALERKIGKRAFNAWYTQDTINRMVQQSGRVGRGFDSFGCTFILDSKFCDVYKQSNAGFPQWFKDRLVMDI